MESVDVSLRFWAITEFGYDPLRGQKQAKREKKKKSKGRGKKSASAPPLDLSMFGSLAETLADLRNWLSSEDMILGNSTTTESDGQNLNVYGSQVIELGGDWFASLVEETPHSQKGVNIFNIGAAPAAPPEETKNVDAEQITGFYSHFWFLPERNEVVTIKVDATWPNASKMRRYVRGFMARHSPRVNVADNRVRSNDGDYLVCRSRFDSHVDRDANTRQRILHGQVERVYMREKITTFLPPKKKRKTRVNKWLTTLTGILGSGAAQQAERPSRLEEEDAEVDAVIKTPLTKDQVEELMDGWEARKDGWTNLGFRVRTGKSTKDLWLRRSIKSASLALDLEVDPETGIVSTESLAKQLMKCRQEILKMVDDE